MSHVIWLTGVSGSGKSTLALALKSEFEKRSKPVEILDGDVVRDFFENDLGYSREERILNVRRVAFAAQMLSQHGVNVIVANIAPYFEVRDFIRRKIENYTQVFVTATEKTLRERDTKGYYAKFESGQMDNMVGQDDKYDEPRNPDLVLQTDERPIGVCLEMLIGLCEEKKVF